MSWPAAVFWLLILYGAARPGALLLYLFTIAASFGALQMIPGQLVGGLNILTQSAVAAVLVASVLARPGNVARAMASAIDPRRMGILIAFALYTVVTAVFLPRVFAGQISVVPMTVAEPEPVPLGPASSNLAQAAYMLLSTGTALAVSLVASRPEFQRHYPLAVLAGGIAAVLTGLLDLATSAVGLGAVLDPFRTATYALLTDAEANGARRVVGLFPEASVYGATCVGFLANLIFIRPLFSPRLRSWAVPAVIFALIGMAVLSTASTAFVGLAVTVLTYGLYVLARLRTRHAIAPDLLVGETVVIAVALLLLFAVVVIHPETLDPITQLIDASVIHKTESDSYLERSKWTRIAWEAFVASHGLGVGVGTVRASNWLVSILSSTGVIGATLLGGFMLRLLLLGPRQEAPAVAELRRALRFSLLPPLAMAAGSGTTPDIGLANALLFGVLVGIGEGVLPVPARPTPVRPALPASSVAGARP